jgi:hypothetical protein
LTPRAPIDRSRPSAVDVLIGVVGRGGRASVTIVNVGIGSIRPGKPLLRRRGRRVLESDELWRVVYRISHSPEVTSAITSSSSNLAG